MSTTDIINSLRDLEAKFPGFIGALHDELVHGAKATQDAIISAISTVNSAVAGFEQKLSDQLKVAIATLTAGEEKLLPLVEQLVQTGSKLLAYLPALIQLFGSLKPDTAPPADPNAAAVAANQTP